ncbi:hypothetical protein C0995_010143 [Termitomyces sp. Mi166|nr:hypothetical protein C0995_010143 [Termitomyces sp. Mi166\
MFAPEEFKRQLKQHAELTNMPHSGIYNNYCFPAVQVNIAPAVAEDECKEKSLKCMAFFGDDHADFDDDGGGLTTMIANSDVPEDYELTWLKLAVFSGLFKHGETPPLSPSGISPESWAYRFMTVLYPPKSMLSGASNQIIGLAALPKGQLFPLALEMTSVGSESLGFQGITNEANWANDGKICAYLLCQLPAHMQAQIDPNTFLSAFSTIDASTDENITAGTWDTDPTGLNSAFWTSSNNDADENEPSLQESLLQEWMEHLSASTAFMPSQRNLQEKLS